MCSLRAAFAGQLLLLQALARLPQSLLRAGECGRCLFLGLLCGRRVAKVALGGVCLCGHLVGDALCVWILFALLRARFIQGPQCRLHAGLGLLRVSGSGLVGGLLQFSLRLLHRTGGRRVTGFALARRSRIGGIQLLPQGFPGCGDLLGSGGVLLPLALFAGRCRLFGLLGELLQLRALGWSLARRRVLE